MTTTMGLSLPAPLKAYLEAEAERRKVSQAAIIKQAITSSREYLEWCMKGRNDANQ